MLRHRISLAAALLTLTALACTEPPAEGEGEEGEGDEGEGEEGEGEEGEGEEGEGEEGEGEGEGEEGEGEGEGEGDLDGGAVCSAGWCFETPLPAGGTLSAVVALSADRSIASSASHFFHLNDDTFAHVGHGAASLSGSGMWAAAEDDVWALIGGVPHHWNGVVWLPDSALLGLNAVSGVASDDIWAVGTTFGVTANIAHKDALGWRSLDNTIEDLILLDVWATGPGTAVAAGVEPLTALPRAVALTLVTADDGAVSVDVDDLGLIDGNFTSQLAVFAVSAGEIWVSTPGRLFHLSGGLWSRFENNTIFGREVWGTSASDVWFAAGPNLVHWDGTSLTQQAVPGATNILAIDGVGEGAAQVLWLADGSGALHRFTPSGSTTRKAPLLINDITDLVVDGAGGLALGRGGELIARSPSGAWSLVASPTASFATGLGASSLGTMLFTQGGAFSFDGADFDLVLGGAGLSDSCVTGDGASHAIGAAATAKLSFGEWEAEPFVSLKRLNTLLCGDANVLAVGGASNFDDVPSLYEHNGERFALRGLSSVVDADALVGVGTAVDDGWVVASSTGRNEQFDEVTTTNVLRLTDGTWREVFFDGVDDVVAVDASAADDVLFVGDAGTAVVFDGAGFVDLSDVGAPDFVAGFAKGNGRYRAVTARGAVWDHDGAAWSETEPAFVAPFSAPLRSVVFFGDDVFALGDFEIHRFAAGAWTDLPVRAASLAASPGAGVYALSDFDGDLLRFSATTGAFDTVIDESFASRGQLVAPRFGTTVFSVGDGAVLRLAGTSFVAEDTDTDFRFGGRLFGFDDTHLVFAGRDASNIDDRALVLTKAGATWSTVTELVEPIGAATLVSGTVYVERDLRVVRERNGVVSELFAAPGLFGQGARAIVLDIDDIWAISGGGLIHFDGAAWSSIPPVGVGVGSLAIGPDGALYAGGGPGVVLRHAP